MGQGAGHLVIICLGLAAFGEGIGAEAHVQVFGRKWRSVHNPAYSLQTSEAFSDVTGSPGAQTPVRTSTIPANPKGSKTSC